MKLNSINIKLHKNKIRPGRGIGSGKGKTCGRGHKGQKSRSGVAIKSFEGGQMPLYRRLPKRGFNAFKNNKNIAILNLKDIQRYFEKNRISSKKLINLDSLKKEKILNKKFNGLKILGSGSIKEKIQVEVNYISKSAKEKIEKTGGSIKISANLPS